MRLNSLALRLFFSATAWTVLILVIVGFVLSWLYRSAVERAFDRRLELYLRALVSDVATPELNARQFPAVAGRAVVRSAAVGLVLAGDAARYADAGGAFVALAVGQHAAASRRPGRAERARRTARRLCGGARGPAAAHAGAQHRSRRGGALRWSRSPAMPARSPRRPAVSTTPCW